MEFTECGAEVLRLMSQGYEPHQATTIRRTATNNPGVMVAFDTDRGRGTAAVVFDGDGYEIVAGG